MNDLQIASLAWGFTIGFGFLTTWNAIKQTANVYKRYGYSRLNSPYIWMIWLEISVCLIFSTICWLYLNAFIHPSFTFYFVILTTWALQVQFLLQIIINRISILLTERRKAIRLKVGVAVLITAINLSVYCIWIPARLQISSKYEYINSIWDRCEKVIYLIVDAMLNAYFIGIVRKRLVGQGLVKYQRLVRFNLWIIGFSLSMDVLIISMMSLKNSFVYMQFHPLAYIVKLNIEMSMADLIAKVSSMDSNRTDSSHLSHLRSQNPTNLAHVDSKTFTEAYYSPGLIKDSLSAPSSSSSCTVVLDEVDRGSEHPWHGNYEIKVTKEVQIEIEDITSDSGGSKEGSILGNIITLMEDDAKPLGAEDRRREDWVLVILNDDAQRFPTWTLSQVSIQLHETKGNIIANLFGLSDLLQKCSLIILSILLQPQHSSNAPSVNFTNHIRAMENFKVDPVKGNISLAIDLRSLTTSSQDGLKLLEKGMLGNGPAATAVKSFLNGTLLLNVAPDGSMTVTAKTGNNFPQFSKLPTEIRLQIWKEAMPGPRVVEVYLVEDQSQYDGKTYYVAHPASRTPTPTILHINHESRREGLKIYSRIFSRSRLPPDHGLKPIYFDPAHDIPYLSHFVTGSLDRWSSVFSMARDAICPWQLAKEHYSQLTWITIPVPKTSSECKDAADSCRYLAALEGITMIINEDDQAYIPQKSMGPTEHQNQLMLCQEESSDNVWWIEAKAKITDRMEDFILKNDIYTLKQMPRIKAGKISRLNKAC